MVLLFYEYLGYDFLFWSNFRFIESYRWLQNHEVHIYHFFNILNINMYITIMWLLKYIKAIFIQSYGIDLQFLFTFTCSFYSILLYRVSSHCILTTSVLFVFKIYFRILHLVYINFNCRVPLFPAMTDSQLFLFLLGSYILDSID